MTNEVREILNGKDSDEIIIQKLDNLIFNSGKETSTAALKFIWENMKERGVLKETGLSLGDKAKDSVSGFTGTITAKIEYLNGTTQFMLQPPVGKDNKFLEAQWFTIDAVIGA